MPQQIQLMIRIKAGPLAALLILATACSGQEIAAPHGPSIVAESALIRVIDQIATPARVPGVLAMVDVEEGDLIKQGQLLAKVDDAEEELIYQRAVIEYELAKSTAANDVAIRAAQKAMEFAREEYERLKKAASGIPGSVSTSELEESRVNAEQAELELEKARHEHKLESLNVRLKQAEQSVALHNKQIHRILAPIDGMVVDVMRHPGEWVEPGEDVLRIVRIDRLRVEGLIPFADVTPALVGSPTEISVAVAGKNDLGAAGHVVFVNPELNPVNGRVRVRAEFDNPRGLLMPGMRARMVIRPRTNDAAPTGPRVQTSPVAGGSHEFAP